MKRGKQQRGRWPRSSGAILPSTGTLGSMSSVATTRGNQEEREEHALTCITEMRRESGDSELKEEDGSHLGWFDPKFPSSPFPFGHLLSYP